MGNKGGDPLAIAMHHTHTNAQALSAGVDAGKKVVFLCICHYMYIAVCLDHTLQHAQDKGPVLTVLRQ